MSDSGSCIDVAIGGFEFETNFGQTLVMSIASSLLLEHSDEVSNTEPRFSVLSAVLNLSATALGGGMLALPKAFANLGVLYGSFAILLVSLATDLTLRWLVQCTHATGLHSYERLTEHLVGPTLRKLLHAFLVVLLFGACVAMMVVFVDSMPRLEGLSRVLVLILFAVLVFPICVPHELRTLSWISGASLACLGYFYFLLSFKAVFSFPNSNEINWSGFPEDYPASTISLSVILSSFICHFNVFKIEQEMGNLPRTYTAIHWAILFICSATYLSFGLAGYLLYGPEVDSNILVSLQDDSVFVHVGKLGISMTNFVKFPLLLVPLRASLGEAFNWSETGHLHHRLALTGSIIGFVTVTAMYLTDLMTLLGLLGSSAGVITAFIFPALLKMALNHQRAEEVARAQFMLEGTEPKIRVRENSLPCAVILISILVGISATWFSALQVYRLG